MSSSLRIAPATDPGTAALPLEAPPAKSVLLRALVAGALCGACELRYRGALPGDVRSLTGALRALGAEIADEAGSLRLVRGPDGACGEPVTVDAGEGAAPARFLLALAGRLARPVTVVGSPGLSRRPMGPLLEALAALGADVRGGPGLPATVRGPLGPPALVPIDARASSQFASALLLALPGCGAATRVALSGPPVSVPYVDLTRSTMAAFGVEVGADLGLPAGARYRPASLDVEADWSGATVLLAAAAFLRRPVRVPRLRRDSLQPDARFAGVLERLGLSVVGSDGSVEARGRVQAGGEFQLTAFPDAAPALAALGALSGDPVRVLGVPHLRLKESDRVTGLVDLLRAAGARARALPDGVEVRTGGRDDGRPAWLATLGDHRLAMAGALLGLARPVVLDDAACVAKSFPGFFDQWPGVRDDARRP